MVIFEVLANVYGCGKISYTRNDEMLRLGFLENKVRGEYIIEINNDFVVFDIITIWYW